MRRFTSNDWTAMIGCTWSHDRPLSRHNSLLDTCGHVTQTAQSELLHRHHGHGKLRNVTNLFLEHC